MAVNRPLAALAALAVAAHCHAEPLHLAIDPSHTAPYYEIGHLGYSIERGTFTKVAGSIDLDVQARTGSVAVSIDVKSLNSNWPERDAVLTGPEFFDAIRYPTIVFKSTMLRFDDQGMPNAVEGQLTLHGVTKPVRLDISRFRCAEHPLLKKPWCGAEAAATVRRSDFGMNAFAGALPDEVHLVIPVEAGPR